MREDQIRIIVSYGKASVPIIRFAYDSIACAVGAFGIAQQDITLRFMLHSSNSFTSVDSEQNEYLEHNHSENSLR